MSLYYNNGVTWIFLLPSLVVMVSTVLDPFGSEVSLSTGRVSVGPSNGPLIHTVGERGKWEIRDDHVG